MNAKIVAPDGRVFRRWVELEEIDPGDGYLVPTGLSTHGQSIDGVDVDDETWAAEVNALLQSLQ